MLLTNFCTKLSGPCSTHIFEPKHLSSFKTNLDFPKIPHKLFLYTRVLSIVRLREDHDIKMSNQSFEMLFCKFDPLTALILLISSNVWYFGNIISWNDFKTSLPKSVCQVSSLSHRTNESISRFILTHLHIRCLSLKVKRDQVLKRVCFCICN